MAFFVMRGDNGRGGAGTRRIPTKSKREPAATFHGQGVDLCGVTTQGPRSGPSTVRHRKSTTLDTVTAASQGFHPPSLSIYRPRISLLESHHPLCRYSEVEGSSLLPWACPATPTPPHPSSTLLIHPPPEVQKERILTGAGRRVPPICGSGQSAICHPYGARHGSPLTGLCGGCHLHPGTA